LQVSIIPIVKGQKVIMRSCNLTSYYNKPVMHYLLSPVTFVFGLKHISQKDTCFWFGEIKW